jgi:hypothetical protein
MYYNLTCNIYLIFLKNEIKFRNVKYSDKTCDEYNSTAWPLTTPKNNFTESLRFLECWAMSIGK